MSSRPHGVLPGWLRGPWAAPAALGCAWIAAWCAAWAAGATEAAEWLSRWSWPLLQGYALAACLRIALDRAADVRIRRAWAVLALAVGLATAGDGIWTVLSLDGTPPFPSIADPFYLASYPVQLVGQLLLPVSPSRRDDRPRFGLDLATVAAAATVGVWHALLRPLAAVHGSDLLSLVAAAGSPVGDLVLLAGVTIVLLRRPDPSTAGAVLILSASILLYVASDLVYASQSIRGTYQMGSWIDFGWMAGPLLIALAALRQRWGAGDPAQVSRTAGLLQRSRLVLPVGATGFGFFLILQVVSSESAGGGFATAAGATVLCALVLTRQIYTSVQNERLADDLAARNRELLALSLLDALTQIANRGAFDGYLSHVWARAGREKTPVALLMCDIDYFKRLNDQAGHLAGDEYLRRVARLLREQARRPEDFVARYGGEEFAVVLPGARLEDAQVVAAKIARALAALGLWHPDSPFGRITLSIGVASTIPEMGASPRMLVDEADHALYRAKEGGRNRIAVANG